MCLSIALKDHFPDEVRIFAKWVMTPYSLNNNVNEIIILQSYYLILSSKFFINYKGKIVKLSVKDIFSKKNIYFCNNYCLTHE